MFHTSSFNNLAYSSATSPPTLTLFRIKAISNANNGELEQFPAPLFDEGNEVILLRFWDVHVKPFVESVVNLPILSVAADGRDGIR